jgi:hypothetical protein
VVREEARVVVPVVAVALRRAVQMLPHEPVGAPEVGPVEAPAVGVRRRVDRVQSAEVALPVARAEVPELAAHVLGRDAEGAEQKAVGRRRRHGVGSGFDELYG